MLPDIAKAEDKIVSNLVLKIKIAVLKHARPPVLRSNIVDSFLSKNVQLRVRDVAGRGISRKPGIQRLHWREVIVIPEVRIRRTPAGGRAAEVRVDQRGIVDTVSAPNHCAAHKVRRISESNSPPKAFEVSVCPGFI